MKILMIGNSFADNTIQYTYDIAKSIGVEDFDVWNLYIGGCSINTHLDNMLNNRAAYELRVFDKAAWCWKSTQWHTINEILDRVEYDYIFFQQASNESGVPETYQNLDRLMDEVEIRSGNAKFCWLMTWPYHPTSSHNDFPRYNNDTGYMYKRICDSVKQNIVPNKRIDRMIPTGTAIYSLYGMNVPVNEDDGFHLRAGAGWFCAALSFMNAFYNIDYSKVFRPEVLSKEDHERVIEAVRRAYVYTITA